MKSFHFIFGNPIEAPSHGKVFGMQEGVGPGALIFGDDIRNPSFEKFDQMFFSPSAGEGTTVIRLSLFHGV